MKRFIIITLATILVTLSLNPSLLNFGKKLSPPIALTSIPTETEIATCNNNGECGAGKFCYKGSCRPTNYCMSTADCTVVAECQSMCQGNECTTTAELCGTMSLLNKDYTYDCAGIQKCIPQTVQCINNGCNTTSNQTIQTCPQGTVSVCEAGDCECQPSANNP